MQIVRSLDALKPGRRKVCLAIGFFDGVHLGHQQIVRQTLEDARIHGARALVVTFDRHPNTVVAPDRVPPLIYPLAVKLRILEALGVDAVLLLRFDQRLSRQSGETFVRRLVRRTGRVCSVCVGANFVFGRHRSGNVALLRRLGAELGFAVHGLAAVSLDGRRVSSTRIRRLISAGRIADASRMLGRPYVICGPVVRGDGLGAGLGFPTANLDVSGLVLPPRGVYVARAVVGGRTYRAVMNLGVRPTLRLSAPPLRVEAHLLDFRGDLYGKELELVVEERLRGERRFASLKSLRRQIERDVARARRHCSVAGGMSR